MALACACVALAACGGGGDAAQPGKSNQGIDPPAACTPIDHPARILLVGDSTRVGYDSLTGATATTPPGELLQQALDARYGAGRAIVTVRAKGGTTAADLIDGADGTGPAWPEGVTADIVVPNYGINEAVAGVPIADYQANLRTLARGPWVTIYETPIESIGQGWDVAPYAEAMRAEAKLLGKVVADTSAYVATTPGATAHLWDGIHPDQALYADIVAVSLAPKVEAQVSSLLCLQ